jgi:hypothetical protein
MFFSPDGIRATAFGAFSVGAFQGPTNCSSLFLSSGEFFLFVLVISRCQNGKVLVSQQLCETAIDAIPRIASWNQTRTGAAMTGEAPKWYWPTSIKIG